MNKRDRFIRDLRNEAKERNLTFRIEKWHGKGSHGMVFVGNECTTIPSREIDPQTANKIRKKLGLK